MKNLLSTLVAVAIMAVLAPSIYGDSDFRNNDQTGDLIADGGLLVAWRFVTHEVTAASTAYQLWVPVFAGTETFGYAGEGIPWDEIMPFNGSVTGLTIRGMVAPMTGSILAEVLINGTGTGLIAYWQASQPSTGGISQQAKDLDTFSSADLLAVRITTSADYTVQTGTTMDLTATVITEMGYVAK